MQKFLVNVVTSEAVSEGHPDKVADQISDAILDLYLSVDPDAKVACETLVTVDNVILAGEVKSVAPIDSKDRETAAREVIHRLGYLNFGFNPYEVKVTDLIHEQSPDINQCVKKKDVAGDQGIMFGYATDESPDYLPLAFSISRKILQNLKNSGCPFLGPDAKSLVSVSNFSIGKPVVTHVTVSTQHIPSVKSQAISDVVKKVVLSTIKEYKDYVDSEILPEIDVNPSGRFVLGGPAADTGLTGRKIIADTYGGVCPHGGGAFSGKDPSKVDRSAAYYARFVAKNLVASGICLKALVSLSYQIGREEPVSFELDTFHTNLTGFSDREVLEKLVADGIFDPRVSNFAPKYRIPIFEETARYGHFGHCPVEKHVTSLGKNSVYFTYPWEEVVQFKSPFKS